MVDRNLINRFRRQLLTIVWFRFYDCPWQPHMDRVFFSFLLDMDKVFRILLRSFWSTLEYLRVQMLPAEGGLRGSSSMISLSWDDLVFQELWRQENHHSHHSTQNHLHNSSHLSTWVWDSFLSSILSPFWPMLLLICHFLLRQSHSSHRNKLDGVSSPKGLV